MRKYLNRKSILAFVALFIVSASLFYTSTLAEKLAQEEKKKVQNLADAIKTLNKPTSNQEETVLASFILTSNNSIPLIITTDKVQIVDFKNIDTTQTKNTPRLIRDKLGEFKEMHEPIIADWGTGRNYVYYGETFLLTQLRYYPYVQIVIIFLFLIVVIFALSASYRSLQNQVWVGLSKETAHQLGTPLSSMEGWLELMRESDPDSEAAKEMQKDLDRLKLVADRFSKVGSEPKLQEENLAERLSEIVAYMQKRSPLKVAISLHIKEREIPVNISGPLFDWVMENLIRNALDSMEGKGAIDITVTNQPQQVIIDVQDTGKGIPKYQVKKIFNPGFTTKKRGWGLGLSLSRRIIEKYHHSSIFVKQSEVGKGTTFRIVLRR
ncbi:sensor histidine kinase [Flavipsychrobacter stenotrophus]|uniref:histidine kinase n=1 Tax=Flavipsychrobacter stenotrophus TaxID=2077091 RepID=A0A2S7ST63_9BACT|nr:HAMP domain-containing sensor histidine kinase [Flavipsychrobacter stenotrophus]PQJ10129.1 sensor histidine kinase [Flavipsychrobacter stenotrophus]